MGLYQFMATGIQTDGIKKGKPRHCTLRRARFRPLLLCSRVPGAVEITLRDDPCSAPKRSPSGLLLRSTARQRNPPQSSSASRFTAGAAGFLNLSQRAAGTVGRVLTLRHDTFEPHFAGMGKDSRAVALHVLIEPDARAGLGQDHFQCRLALCVPKTCSVLIR